MPEETPDVNPSDSSPDESIQNETPPAVNEETPQDSPTEAQAESATVGIPSPETPPAQQTEVDEMGVPWKNRYMESQRKLDKMSEQLNAVAEKINSSQGQQRGEYSIEELEAFAESTDNPAHRTWAKGEIRKLEKKEFETILDSKLTEKERALQAEQMRSAVFNEVMVRHPEAFKKNAQGQFIGWDPASPMAQRIAQHMQDPELKDNPRGLRVAAALAYQELGSNYTAQAAKQTTQAKAQVKDLQKKTLTEGGGVSSPPSPKTPLSAAKEKFSQTGRVKDGAEAFKEILKARGRISEDS